MKLPFFKKKKAAAEQPAAPAKPAAARTPFPLAAHQEVEIPAIHIGTLGKIPNIAIKSAISIHTRASFI